MDEQDAESIIDKVIETQEEEEKKNASVSWIYVILFHFLGTASFAPVNFYVSSNEYWMYKFRNLDNETDTQKTDFQKNFTAYVGIAGVIATLTFVFLLFLFQKKISLQKRIVGCLIMLLGLFALTLIFVFVDTDSWQGPFFRLSLLIGGLLNGFSAALLFSLFQLASRFPPRCLVAQLAGQNIGGILAALIQIISLAAAHSVTGTAGMYYGVATVAIAIIISFYLYVVYTSQDFRTKLMVKPKDGRSSAKKRAKFEFDLVKRVVKKLALLAIALVLSVVSTAVLHPGLTALIESSGKGTNLWSDTYFLPVCVFLLYNSFEFIGREISNHFSKLKNIYVIFPTSIFKVSLLPLLLLCNLQPRNHLPVVFHDDAYFIVFFIVFALAGGYLANIGILALNKYCEPEERMVGLLFMLLIMIVVMSVSSVLSGMVVNLI